MIELSNLAMYASGRIVLGAVKTPRAVGLYEGPVRAHNLLYALGGALAVPTVPTASRYVATGDDRRLSELAVRGSRYTLALFVPLCVTLMTLASRSSAVWLGERYTDGAAALTILVSYWLLYGALIVTPGFLAGAGRGARRGADARLRGGAEPGARSDPHAGAGRRGARGGDRRRARRGVPVLLRGRAAGVGRAPPELLGRALIPAYVLGAVLGGRLARDQVRPRARHAAGGRGGCDRRGGRCTGSPTTRSCCDPPSAS